MTKTTVAHKVATRTATIGAALVVGSMALVGCSSSNSSSQTSASPSPMSLTAACQGLATILNPLVDGSITNMTQPEQNEAYQAARSQLQATLANVPPQLKSDLEAVIAAIPAVTSANTTPGSSASASGFSKADLAAMAALLKPEEGLSTTCQTVNVTIG